MRDDIYDVSLLLELALDDAQHPSIRRGAAEVAAIHGTESAVAQLMSVLRDRRHPPARRMLACDALVALQAPHLTLRAIEDAAFENDSSAVRINAIALMAKLKNLRSVSALVKLLRDRDASVCEAADAALVQIIEANGGREQAIEKMLTRAAELLTRGKPQGAYAIVIAILVLDPLNARARLLKARADVH